MSPVNKQVREGANIKHFVPVSARQALKGAYLANKKVIFDVLLASLLLNLFALAIPVFVMNVYDRVVPNAAIESLWVLASGVTLVVAFEALIKLLRHVCLDDLGRRIDVGLSAYLFRHMLNVFPDQARASAAGMLSSLQQFEHVRQFLSGSVVVLVLDIPFALVFLFFVMGIGGSQLVLVPLVAIMLMMVLGYGFYYRQRQLTDDYQQQLSQSNLYLLETLQNLEEVQSSARGDGRLSGWRAMIDTLTTVNERLRRGFVQLQSLSVLIAQFALVALVISGVYAITEYALSMGALIACVLLLNRILMPFSALSSLMAQYHQAKSALNGLDALLKQPAYDYLQTGENRDEKPVVSASEALHFDIQFAQFAYSYPETKQEVLNIPSLEIRSGEKLAIVGAMGSGKSSLLRAVAGLCSGYQGAIKISGRELAGVSRYAYHRQVGYLPQQIKLFKGTIRENLSLGENQDSDLLAEAVRLSGLENCFQGVHELLGYDVGEHGERLSGGQRQCIGLARCFMGRPGMIILDEPTQGLDAQAEQYLKTSLEAHLQDQTLIMATHKASMLGLVDRIVVLAGGKIIADGSKQSILAGLQNGSIKVVSGHAE